MKSAYSKFQTAHVAHGIMFHHFHGQGYPQSQGSIDKDQLAEMVDFLGGHHRILNARDWLEKALAGRLERDDLVLTFDDGLLCQMDLAVPTLKSMGHTGFFFIYSSVFHGQFERLEIYRAYRTKHFGHVDEFYDRFSEEVENSSFGANYTQAMKGFSPHRYLQEYPFYSDGDRAFRFVRDEVLGPKPYEEIMDRMIEREISLESLSRSLWMRDRDLEELTAGGHVVGLHSYSHLTRLENVSDDEQETEYTLNKEHLTGVLREDPITVSHPCNSYNSATLRILARLGVQVGFRANMASPDRKGLEYPREDHANVVVMMEQARA